ncbi:MAG: protoporphyrinogen oxidase, partial [Verrucomicrobia bacterium]|nr:protoporphyrinogen oxidase [Verrucomicrobiota bacterium]
SVKHGFPKLYALEQKYGSLIRGQILGAKERRKRETVSKDRAKQFSFDQGLQVLTDALAHYVGDDLCLNTRVAKLTQGRAGQWEIADDTGEKLATFDEVIVSLPAYRLAELDFKFHIIDGVQKLNGLKDIVYPPVSSVVLGFKREDVEHPLNGFGTLNPEVENVNTLGTLFTSSLFPDRAPQGHVLLTTYVGGARSPELALKPEGERMELVLKDLRAIYGIKGEPVFRHSFLYEKAIPQYEVGYGKYLKAMTQFEVDQKSIHLAGHCKDGISLADSIVSGEKIAEKVIAKV